MSYDTILKVGTFLLGAIATWKVVIELLRGHQAKLREEYRFAKEFLADLARSPQMHPFLKGKGYQALVGDTQLASEEIEYLLMQRNRPTNPLLE